MSMQLISEKLLEREIEELEKSVIIGDIYYNLCKKELAVIAKLKINKIDMRGKIDETKERIERQAVYFMDIGEFEEMEEKARKYDEICNIVNSKQEVWL